MNTKQREALANKMLVALDKKLRGLDPEAYAEAQLNVVGIMAAELIRFAHSVDLETGATEYRISSQYIAGLRAHIDNAEAQIAQAERKGGH